MGPDDHQADRVIFDKLIQILVVGCGCPRIAETTCSASTLRLEALRQVLAERGMVCQIATRGQPAPIQASGRRCLPSWWSAGCSAVVGPLPLG